MTTKATKKVGEPTPRAKVVRVHGVGLRAGRRGVSLSLQTLRVAAGKTQRQVETETGIDQSDVSRLEAAESFDDRTVGTLRRYAKAIGGDVELVFVRGDKRITLAGPPRRVEDDDEDDEESPSSESGPESSGERSASSR
jgi:transcriptional regulator with XRE-family HTH domain